MTSAAWKTLWLLAAMLLGGLLCGYAVVMPSHEEAKREYDRWLRDGGAAP